MSLLNVVMPNGVLTKVVMPNAVAPKIGPFRKSRFFARKKQIVTKIFCCFVGSDQFNDLSTEFHQKW
jgi:hypothetical protein